VTRVFAALAAVGLLTVPPPGDEIRLSVDDVTRILPETPAKPALEPGYSDAFPGDRRVSDFPLPRPEPPRLPGAGHHI
jgi:hypothetical protein